MASNNTLGISAQQPDLLTQYQYVVTGSLAALCNIIVIFVLIRNKQILKKFSFIAGLAFGDIIDALAMLGSGVSRILRAFGFLFNGMVPPFNCMSGSGLTPLFLLGNQIPGVMFFLIGIERVVAIYFFQWYYKRWNNRLAWKCTAWAYVFCALSLLAAYIVAYYLPTATLIPVSCGTPFVIDSLYLTFNYLVSIVGGTVVIVATIVAMGLLIRQKKKLATMGNLSSNLRKHFKAQWQMTHIMFCVAVLDLALVVVPNILLMLSNGLQVLPSGSVATWSLQVICSRSVLNVFIYVVINEEFRAATLNAFGIKTFNSKVFVTFLAKHSTVVQNVNL